MNTETSSDPVSLATELTIAWLSNQNNRVHAEDVLAFLRKMHETVTELGGKSHQSKPSEPETPEAEPEFTPAVTVRKSLASRDHIISLIDGKPYKTLRRHLARHGLTAEEYRARYKLKADYPMTAPAYSEARSDMARKIGLGAKGRGKQDATASTEDASSTKPKRTRAKSSPA